MLNEIIKISIDAGNAIMEIYNSADFGVEMKDDNSPLTLADKASHEIIEDKLKKLTPEIPILSEEGRDIPYETRKSWNRFWLVDPLDGTKEFIKKNGEFTVNIALIENGEPTLGVIYAPAYESNKSAELVESKEDLNILDEFEGTLYYGTKESGAFKAYSTKHHEPSTTNQRLSLIVSSPISVLTPNSNKVVAVKSRSHSSEDEQKILDQYGVTDSISVGSSLKFCMVAEGQANIYYRHGPTNEWDVGAGHAIVAAAGGIVEGLAYNKEIILNGSFLVKYK